MASELKTFKNIHDSVIEKTGLNGDSSDASNFVNRIINERYVDISQLQRWRWLRETSSTIVPAVYTAGSVTVASNSATVVGSNVAFTSAMVGRKVYFESESELYTILSRSSATRLVLTETYQGPAISGGKYRIFQDTFTAASNCEEIIDVWHYPPGLGVYRTLHPISPREMLNLRMRYPSQEGHARYWTTAKNNSSGYRQIEIWSPSPESSYRLRYEYIKKISSLAATNDEPLMPVTYRSAVMWGAVSDVYLQQGNTQRMNWAEQKYQMKVKEMKQDDETTDRRIKFIAPMSERKDRISPARFDLGRAFDDDSYED